MADEERMKNPNTDVYELCASCGGYRFIGEKCPNPECDMAADPPEESQEE